MDRAFLARPVTFIHPMNFGLAPDGTGPMTVVHDSSDAAVLCAQRGQFNEAERLFHLRLQEAPSDSVSHHNFAVFLSERRRIEEAVREYEEAIRLNPKYAQARRNFGILLMGERRFDDALRQLWTAVSITPDDIGVLIALGNTLLQAKRSEGAVPVFQQACRIAPQDAILYNQLGLALFDSGRFEEAKETFLEALRRDYKLVGAHNNLGSLYKAIGRTEAAFSCFELALTLDPGSQKTRWNRALTLLAVGELERGWEEYEWRWRAPETPHRKYDNPVWNGQSLENRTIFLYPEQGLGDSIQFIRYASLLKERGARVIFECPSPLSELFKGVSGIDMLSYEGGPQLPFDYHSPLMGLPRALKTNLGNVPAAVPYIAPNPDRVKLWHDRLRELSPSQDRLVGIAWQGNPHHQWDHFRSLPLLHFERLTRISGIRLVSLQRGPGIGQIEPFNQVTNNKLLVPTDGQQTKPEHLADTAAILANLDLVITVDTATAHLAAALGRPTWTLLSFVADWRWMVDRLDSPWYPTMRLFRQKSFGDWDELFGRVTDNLQYFARSAHAQPRETSSCVH